MTEWLRLARTPSIVRRALKYAIGVGAILIVINHGEAIVRRDISLARLFRMVLTMAVPYMVSTASSVSALRDRAPVGHIDETTVTYHARAPSPQDDVIDLTVPGDAP